MQRLRVRYSKEGKVRFVSARDLTSVWERALRRADLPIAYSEGFHPHPKVSFPDALPVGIASTGEYAELHLGAPIQPGRALAAVSATLPAGMDILTFQVASDGAPKLAKLLQATIWEAEYPSEAPDATVALLAQLADEALDASELPVSRVRPHGRSAADPGGDERTVDLRPALLTAGATLREGGAAEHRPAPPTATEVATAGDHPLPILRVLLRNDGPAVRPTDLHELLRPSAAVVDLAPPRLVRRVVQGRPDGAGLCEALTGAVEPLLPARVPTPLRG